MKIPLHLVNRQSFALSGLIDLSTTLTQGVALGWIVDAPSGRYSTGLRSRSLICAFAILLFAVALPSFASELRQVDGAQRCLSPEGATTNQATPWVGEQK